MSVVRMALRDPRELPESTIAAIVESALREQALLDRLADAVRSGSEEEIVAAARAVCHAAEK
jgi:hypothetical protein